MDLLVAIKALKMWLIHLSQYNQLKRFFFIIISWKVCLEFWLSLQHASAAELLFAVLVQEAEITAGSGY